MFEAKITCDAFGCTNEKTLESTHPSDAETEIECISERPGDWLIDYDNDSHYCPNCALQCANELGLEYSTR